MCRLSRSTHHQQETLIRRCEAAGATRRQIAEIAGVDATMVSKWTSDGEDGRTMGAVELLKLADALGWDAVLGASAAAAGYGLERVTATTTRPVEEIAADIAESATAVRHPKSEGGHLVVASERPVLAALCREYLGATAGRP